MPELSLPGCKGTLNQLWLVLQCLCTVQGMQPPRARSQHSAQTRRGGCCSCSIAFHTALQPSQHLFSRSGTGHALTAPPDHFRGHFPKGRRFSRLIVDHVSFDDSCARLPVSFGLWPAGPTDIVGGGLVHDRFWIGMSRGRVHASGRSTASP